MSVKLIIASLINQLVTFPRSKGKIVVYNTSDSPVFTVNSIVN